MIVTNVGPVHRKERQKFNQRSAEAIESDVSGMAIAARDALENMGQLVDIPRHVPPDDEPLCILHQLVIGGYTLGKLHVHLFKALVVLSVAIEAVDAVERFENRIPDGATG